MKIDARRFDDTINELESNLKKFVSAELSVVRNDIAMLWNLKGTIDGKEYLDNQDVCMMLGIHKRTLARYRQKRLIPYYKFDRKVQYKKNEVMDYLFEHGRRAKPEPGIKPDKKQKQRK